MGGVTPPIAIAGFEDDVAHVQRGSVPEGAQHDGVIFAPEHPARIGSDLASGVVEFASRDRFC